MAGSSNSTYVSMVLSNSDDLLTWEESPSLEKICIRDKSDVASLVSDNLLGSSIVENDGIASCVEAVQSAVDNRFCTRRGSTESLRFTDAEFDFLEKCGSIGESNSTNTGVGGITSNNTTTTVTTSTGSVAPKTMPQLTSTETTKAMPGQNGHQVGEAVWFDYTAIGSEPEPVCESRNGIQHRTDNVRARGSGGFARGGRGRGRGGQGGRGGRGGGRMGQGWRAGRDGWSGHRGDGQTYRELPMTQEVAKARVSKDEFWSEKAGHVRYRKEKKRGGAHFYDY